jgi:hypothetical protein
VTCSFPTVDSLFGILPFVVVTTLLRCRCYRYQCCCGTVQRTLSLLPSVVTLPFGVDYVCCYDILILIVPFVVDGDLLLFTIGIYYIRCCCILLLFRYRWPFIRYDCCSIYVVVTLPCCCYHLLLLRCSPLSAIPNDDGYVVCSLLFDFDYVFVVTLRCCLLLVFVVVF